MQDNKKKGGISVETENIFPVIKKWLYSEKDIFLREIVSNATDAVTKFKRLQSLGQIPTEDEAYRIDVVLNEEQRTITVTDNGIGMTEEELSRYICQIALSGALEFIQKYEGQDNASDGIIGHFGLGFYSAFMVSEQVEIITKSYLDAPAVHWTCSDVGEYEMEQGTKETRGTTVIMHISEEEKEYLNEFKLRGMLEKYCSFMPVNIYFTCIKEDGATTKEAEEPINQTTPLWLKSPSECTPEEYNEFYKKLFGDFRDPLFYIHINADYPLNFKGILFFPSIRNEYETIEGQVKLYYNQVFVSENVKEMIPDYMIMLRGVLDCPELPLNVSRSYLQTNSYVSKVSSHIVKKVADKLNSLCNTEYEAYEKVWESVKLFVEFACMRDKKFYDRVKDSLLLKLTNGSYVRLNEHIDRAKEKSEGVVYYATDKSLQAQYISLFEKEEISVAHFDKSFEIQFLSMLEQYMENVKFVRVDSEVASALKNQDSAEENQALSDLFKDASGCENLKITFENLRNSKTPAILNISEDTRRMEEMMRMYSGETDFTLNNNQNQTLVLNTSSPLIQKINVLMEKDSEKAKQIASHIYKLAVLSQRRLSAEEMLCFLDDSFSILENI